MTLLNLHVGLATCVASRSHGSSSKPLNVSHIGADVKGIQEFSSLDDWDVPRIQATKPVARPSIRQNSICSSAPALSLGPEANSGCRAVA